MAKNLCQKVEQFVIIKLYYKAKTNKFGVIKHKMLEEEEAKSLISSGDKDVDVLTTKWSVPSWKSNSNIVRSSTFYNPTEGLNKIDWSKYQENLIKSCLKEWDIVDENDVPVPVTSENIGSLPPLIVSAILDKFESSLSLEEEDKKK